MCSSSIIWIIRWVSNIKKAEHAPPSFPKSYHELNLLMLWSSKCKPRGHPPHKFLDETPQNGLKCTSCGYSAPQQRKRITTPAHFGPTFCMFLSREDCWIEL